MVAGGCHDMILPACCSVHLALCATHSYKSYSHSQASRSLQASFLASVKIYHFTSASAPLRQHFFPSRRRLTLGRHDGFNEAQRSGKISNGGFAQARSGGGGTGPLPPARGQWRSWVASRLLRSSSGRTSIDAVVVGALQITGIQEHLRSRCQSRAAAPVPHLADDGKARPSGQGPHQGYNAAAHQPRFQVVCASAVGEAAGM